MPLFKAELGKIVAEDMVDREVTPLSDGTQETTEEVVVFEFSYILDAKEWRTAADSAETLDAFGRSWRVPLGIVFALLGAVMLALPFIVISLGQKPFGAAKTGFALIAWSIIAGWRPLYQDIKFRLHLPPGRRISVEMTRRRMVVNNGGSTTALGWNEVKCAISSTDGVLMELVKGSQPLWIPVRLFSGFEQRCELDRFIGDRGIEQRIYGSG